MWQVPEPKEEWIENFLTVRAPAEGPTVWVSSFSVVVRDARLASGRNLETGLVENVELVGNWLGALAYLVMLDQVGECFRPTRPHRLPVHNASLVKALTYFAPSLTDDQALAVYALRCAFAHDYGLVNRSQGGRNSGRLNHRFLLLSDALSPLVDCPDPLWDGDWSTSRDSKRTRINVRALGDLAERIVSEMLIAHRSRRILVALRGGVDELFARFAMTITSDTDSEAEQPK
jgi:hypothetical protein